VTAARIVALGAWVLGAGCAHRADSPTAIVAAFGDALARGDLRAAYALTSDGFRARMPFEAFAAPLDAPGTAALGRELADNVRRAPRVRVSLSLGDEMPVALEHGGWRIDGGGIDPWDQSTPRAALRTFVRAVDMHRYDILLRLIPDRYRPGLDTDKLHAFWEGERRSENRAVIERVRAALGAAITESGDEARLRTGPDRLVRLVCEEGRWKIDDPDAR
jgi:hypothetical protein